MIKDISSLKVLYFSDAGPKLSVFASQSVGMYKAWSNICHTDLIYRHRGEIDPEVPGKALKQIGSAARLLLWLESSVNKLKNIISDYDIVHCRGQKTAWMAIKSRPAKLRKKVRIIYDNRGLIIEENRPTISRLTRQPQSLISCFEYGSIERYAVDNCDTFLVLTEEMSTYFNAKYNRTADLVVPCIVDKDKFVFSSEKREKLRRQLGIHNNRVFLYVGGTDHWQRLDLLGRFWKSHAAQNSDDILIVLTRDKHAFIKALGIDIDRIKESIIFDFVPYEKVPGYMFAADFGVIFRDDSIISRVASPVKLNEYLSAGLTVITNQEYIYKRHPKYIEMVGDDFRLPEGIGIKTHNERLNISLENSKWFSGESAVEKIINIL